MRLFSAVPKKVLCLSLCLLLTGCASRNAGPEAKLRAVRARYAAAEQLTGALTLTADYGERVYTYEAELCGGAAAGTLRVTKPDNIAGAVLQWSDGSTRLSCEDVTLETGALSERLSPAQAIPTLLTCLREGTLLSCGWEESYLYAQLAHPVHSQLTASCWFDSESAALRRCELAEEGRCLLTLDFAALSLSEAAQPSDAR